VVIEAFDANGEEDGGPNEAGEPEFPGEGWAVLPPQGQQKQPLVHFGGAQGKVAGHSSASPSPLRNHDPGSEPRFRKLEGELELTRPSRGRGGWRLGRAPERFEDLAHDQAIGQEHEPFALSD